MKKLLDIKALHIKTLFLFSGIAMAILLASGGIKSLIIGIFISILTWYFLIFRYNILDKIFSEKISKRLIIISIFFSIITVCYWLFINRYYKHFNNLDNIIMAKVNRYIDIPLSARNILVVFIKIGVIASSLISFFAIYLFYLFFLDFLYKVGCHLIITAERMEKRYFVIVSVVITILVVVIFCITTVFYEGSKADGNKIHYDIVYTFDSPDYIITNVYANITAYENDIRQPLFGVFALPFGISSLIISKFLFFLPGSYAIIITIVQAILLQICIILLGRIIALKGLTSIAFYLFMTFSYPCLLFSFAPEQYIFPVLWLMLLLYIHYAEFYTNIKNERTILYIATTGSLLTNGILLVFIPDHKSKRAIKTVSITVITFILTCVIFGKTDILLNSVLYIKNLMQFAGSSIGLCDRLLQYFNFVSICFLMKSPIFLDNTKGFISYQLAPITTLNILGVGLFMFVIVSFIMNRNNKFAKFCIFWVAYSFIILCIIGWGTAENGLILYSLYFGWAFICLTFMGIEKLIYRLQTIKYFIFICFIFFLAYVNIPAIYDIIKFWITYYPVNK